MRVSLILFLAMLYAATGNAQTCPCSGLSLSGSSFDSGTPGYDQNSSNDFCIADGDTYTGSLPNTTGGSLTICGIWAPSSSVNLSINGDFTITNNGELNMGSNNFVYSGNGDVFVNNGVITSMAIFEIAESTFENNGQLTAEDIYLHGVVVNSATGVMTSTAVCGGNPNNSCGFFIGDKGVAFINDGSFVAVDFFSRVPVTGSGTVDASNTIQLRGDYGSTTSDNTFTAPTISLVESNVTQSGTYYANTFNCDLNTFDASACTLDGSATHDLNDGGTAGTDCQSGAINNPDCLAALPIEIISFSITETNDFLVFNWESGEEINFSHFELQEGSDLSSFGSVLKMEGKGRNSIYQSSKINKKRGTFYYRLKLVDIDGSVEYHDKVLSTSNQASESSVEIYPNPVLGGDRLFIKNLEGKSAVLSLYDMDGRKLTSKVLKEKDETYLELEEFDLIHGSYVLEVVMGSRIFTEKVVILK